MNLFNATFSNLANQTRTAGKNNSFFPFNSLFGSLATTASGKKINHKTSLKISAFWCGVNTIADSIALLPKHIYQKTDGKRTNLTAHPVTHIIHREPNKCMTACNFWFAMAVSAIVRGNAYAKIVRSVSGQLLSLEFIHPDECTVYRNNGELWYRVSGENQILFSDEVFHITGFTWDGIVGIGAVQYAADSMATSLEADIFAADAYGDRGLSYGIIETDNSGLNPNGKKALQKVFDYNLTKGDKHRVTVLDEGMKYKPISITPAESKFIEAKAQGVEDIARWLKIPLHKLHAKGEGGYNFLVQMSIEYMQTAVMPITQRIKEEIERKLLTPAEKAQGLGVFINYRKLLEADPKARAQYYKDLWFIRAINSNEIRELEDMNPYDGGEQFLQPANMLSEMQLQNQMQDE